jgi:hypothetical protein
VSWFLKPAELMPKIILIGEPAVLSCWPNKYTCVCERVGF